MYIKQTLKNKIHMNARRLAPTHTYKKRNEMNRSIIQITFNRSPSPNRNKKENLILYPMSFISTYIISYYNQLYFDIYLFIFF